MISSSRRGQEKHFWVLKEVLNRSEEAGVRLKGGKCKLFQNQVEYLEHIVDARGLHPTGEKVKTLQEAPRPVNKAKLSSYLGCYGIINMKF